MRAFYTDRFVLPLPPEHRFPMSKYRRLREAVIAEGIVRSAKLDEPPAATDTELARGHTEGYLDRFRRGLLTREEIRRIGFPWSPEMVERSRRSVGATLSASRAALEDGVAVNLAGGTHHAFPDHGEGFCALNDSVVAARSVIDEGAVRKVAVLDCDVHQGNGTAAACRGWDDVFTFSMHGRKNYPHRKQESDLDVALDDGTEDEAYLEALDRALVAVFARFAPELAIYVSGADPLAADRLGRLSLSRQGLAERDRRVLAACRDRDVPVVVTMAGGYADDVEVTVAAHLATVRAAREAAGS